MLGGAAAGLPKGDKRVCSDSPPAVLCSRESEAPTLPVLSPDTPGSATKPCCRTGKEPPKCMLDRFAGHGEAPCGRLVLTDEGNWRRTI